MSMLIKDDSIEKRLETMVDTGQFAPSRSKTELARRLLAAIVNEPIDDVAGRLRMVERAATADDDAAPSEAGG